MGKKGLLKLSSYTLLGVSILGVMPFYQVSAGMVQIHDITQELPSGEDVVTKIWNKVHELGGTDEGAAALLGNLQVESQLKTDIVQDNQIFNEYKAMDSKINGYGIGLAQWDGRRRVSLINEANKEEKNWENIDFQISYLFDQEGEDSSLIKQLIKQTDLNQTTEQIMILWERAGNDESLAQRLGDANYWLESFRSKSTSTCPTASVPNGWTIDQPIDTSGYTTSGYNYRECTWWAYNRSNDFGIHYGLYMGSGASWQNQPDYVVTTIPTLHSVVSFNAGQTVGEQWQADSTYGHVAFVEAIHPDGSILISQSGTGFQTEYTYQVLSAREARGLHYVIGN
ncbi:phage tail tip lysozyme [Lactococcus lactis]|uniref:Phage tail tip lysozyme n=1 Tax=Lactococcus lactis TaxID=1358 RepID=A0A9X4NI68_9LACT|nr:phage tail tip lysozyme [Lactococcus lactis]MDG4983877.1 phage tail tip lysozyme [Lactococcus lactis]